MRILGETISLMKATHLETAEKNKVQIQFNYAPNEMENEYVGPNKTFFY